MCPIRGGSYVHTHSWQLYQTSDIAEEATHSMSPPVMWLSFGSGLCGGDLAGRTTIAFRNDSVNTFGPHHATG